jgi:site-specific DNA-methyltransferase (adenine-specific)
VNKWIANNGEIFQADALELVKSLPDESVDCIITDYAYESLEKWRSTGTTTRLKHSKSSSNDWFKTFPNVHIPELLSNFYRVLKKGTFLYMFCDEETRDIICCGQSPQSGTVLGFEGTKVWSPVVDAGFKYHKSLIWDKCHKGMGYHFPAQHEFIIMAEKTVRKGKHRRLNFNTTGDVLAAPRLKGKKFWPTEKPLSLFWKLVTESTNEGDVCCDPFCGSGVLGTACELTNRKYILGDINPVEAVKRLRGIERVPVSTKVIYEI